MILQHKYPHIKVKSKYCYNIYNNHFGNSKITLAQTMHFLAESFLFLAYIFKVLFGEIKLETHGIFFGNMTSHCNFRIGI